jgi:hypothetical protein
MHEVTRRHATDEEWRTPRGHQIAALAIVSKLRDHEPGLAMAINKDEHVGRELRHGDFGRYACGCAFETPVEMLITPQVRREEPNQHWPGHSNDLSLTTGNPCIVGVGASMRTANHDKRQCCKTRSEATPPFHVGLMVVQLTPAVTCGERLNSFDPSTAATVAERQ